MYADETRAAYAEPVDAEPFMAEPFMTEPFMAEPLDAPAPDTGDARVDAVLAPLSRLRQAAVADHPNVYDDVHRGLQDALADLDRD
jgi:hypothetical protein